MRFNQGHKAEYTIRSPEGKHDFRVEIEDNAHYVDYHVRIPKSMEPHLRIRSGMLSQHGVAAWIDDIEMAEEDGVHRMDTESVAFFLLNAAFIIGQREAVLRDGEILADPDTWLGGRLREELPEYG